MKKERKVKKEKFTDVLLYDNFIKVLTNDFLGE